jgi:hypothetical protein
MKGQVAFESLFLMLIIISSAVAITTLYLQSHQENIALTLTKEETIKQLNSKDSYSVIKKLTIDKTSASDININVYLDPVVPIDTGLIKTKVLSKTTYNSLNINIR